MRVLIIASKNSGNLSPFVVEQAHALLQQGIEVDYFGVFGKGIKGYLKALSSLRKKIKEFQPDIIHAHYGLSGLLANLQRKVPVVTTYHGSDINVVAVRRFSKMAMQLSAWNVFVSQRNVELVGIHKKFSLLPCGIDVDNFVLQNKQEARDALGWDSNDRYVLFAGAFDNTVKNAPLAQAAVQLLSDVHLVELKGYSRQEVATLFYAADALLLTSFTEGSPQVVKEAMACNCPVVTVDVGDVRERLAHVQPSAVVERNPQSIADALRVILEQGERSNGREELLRQGLDNRKVAEKLIQIYNNILKYRIEKI